MQNDELNNPNYHPNAFLDWLRDDVWQLKNDAALSRKLDVAPPVISKIRHRKLSIGPALLIKIHDLTDLSIRELRAKLVAA